jgi:C4-dicarboxylate transporter DctM subunit
MEILAFWLTLMAGLIGGMPVAVTLAVGAFAVLLLFAEGLSAQAQLMVFAQRLFGGADSFAILALPLFFLAGALMEAGGISERLVRFAMVLIGWIRGGLAMVAVVAEIFFSGISGSASADAAAVGGVMIPEMKKRGYTAQFSASVIAAGGAIGPIIPPSIGLVVYGSLADVSISALFVGGVIPGLMIGLALLLLCGYLAVRRNFPKEPVPTMREIGSATLGALIPLAAPGIILGGIFGGIFTATESAMVAVVYGVLVGRFVYRTISWRQAFDICYACAISSSRVMFIIAVASFVGWVLAREQVPQQMAEALLGWTSDPLIVLILINLILLAFGCFLEGLAIMLILLPTLLPIIHQLGIDPLFFGVIMMVNIAIGTVTPPVGTCLVVSSAIADIPMERMLPEIWRFIFVMIAALLLMVVFPQTVLWLPDLLFGD